MASFNALEVKKGKSPGARQVVMHSTREKGQ